LTPDNVSKMSFFCFNPNKGHRRHGVWRYCNLPRHLEGNKSRTRLVFTLNNQEISQSISSRRHRHGLGKCLLGCASRYICYTHVPMGGIACFWQSYKSKGASLFPIQLTLEGALNLLALLNPSDFPQGPWAIQAHHPNIDGCLEVIDLHTTLLVVQPTEGCLHHA
jgi:hypothetical protein